MNPLEVVGITAIGTIVCFFIYILIIDPIVTMVQAYKYNKEVYELESLEREVQYWYDKMHLLTMQTVRSENILRDKDFLMKLHDEYKKNNDIIREEIHNGFGYIMKSNNPKEMSERYYQVHANIRNIKAKLGVKY